MPESKSRKKPTPRPGREGGGTAPAAAPKGNPRWLVPTMLGLMIAGLAWIVTTYISAPGGTTYPIPPLGQWNLAIGFVLLFAGFGLTLRWR